MSVVHVPYYVSPFFTHNIWCLFSKILFLRQQVDQNYGNGLTLLALQSHRCRTGRRFCLVPRHTALLAGERQQKQRGQMPETAEKELAGILPVAMAIEPKGQVADVKVNRQGH